jgi:hypothetical protein
MTSASGFTWVAREPQLMVGAKGRASAQRSIDYHVLPVVSKAKNGQLRGAFLVNLTAGMSNFAHFPHLLPYDLTRQS